VFFFTNFEVSCQDLIEFSNSNFQRIKTDGQTEMTTVEKYRMSDLVAVGGLGLLLRVGVISSEMD
jgi:hypothetical protein